MKKCLKCGKTHSENRRSRFCEECFEKMVGSEDSGSKEVI